MAQIDHVVLVTSFGLSAGSHADVVNHSVTLEQLFR